MRLLILSIIVINSLLCTCLSAAVTDNCGSYDRYVLKFMHVYHANLEANVASLIEKYKEKHGKRRNYINNDIYQEISSIIVDPTSNEEIRLNIVSMTDNKNYLEREMLRLAESIRCSFGFAKDDYEFMDDKFILGPKGAKYKHLQEDILRYSSAINNFISTREVGDQYVLSVKDGKGSLEYKPFNKEEKKKLIENADLRIMKLIDNIKETERQLIKLPDELREQENKIKQREENLKRANEARKILEDEFYERKMMLREKLKMLKRKKKEVDGYKKTLVRSYTFQSIKPQKLVFDNPQIIRRTISSYIVKDRCLIDEMPEEMLCILVCNIITST